MPWTYPRTGGSRWRHIGRTTRSSGHTWSQDRRPPARQSPSRYHKSKPVKCQEDAVAKTKFEFGTCFLSIWLHKYHQRQYQKPGIWTCARFLKHIFLLASFYTGLGQVVNSECSVHFWLLFCRFYFINILSTFLPKWLTLRVIRSYLCMINNSVCTVTAKSVSIRTETILLSRYMKYYVHYVYLYWRYGDVVLSKEWFIIRSHCFSFRLFRSARCLITSK